MKENPLQYFQNLPNFDLQQSFKYMGYYILFEGVYKVYMA